MNDYVRRPNDVLPEVVNCEWAEAEEEEITSGKKAKRDIVDLDAKRSREFERISWRRYVQKVYDCPRFQEDLAEGLIDRDLIGSFRWWWTNRVFIRRIYLGNITHLPDLVPHTHRGTIDSIDGSTMPAKMAELSQFVNMRLQEKYGEKSNEITDDNPEMDNTICDFMIWEVKDAFELAMPALEQKYLWRSEGTPVRSLVSVANWVAESQAIFQERVKCVETYSKNLLASFDDDFWEDGHPKIGHYWPNIRDEGIDDLDHYKRELLRETDILVRFINHFEPRPADMKLGVWLHLQLQTCKTMALNGPVFI